MQIWMQPIPALLITSLAATASATTPTGGEEPTHLGGLSDQAAPQAPAQDAGTDMTVIKTFFKDGMRFETPDKSFQFKLGAKIFFDTAFIGTNKDFSNAFETPPNPDTPEQDGSKFRLARISGEGVFNQKIEFKWQYDFAPGKDNEVKFKDLYLGLRNTWAGNVRAGQFKEPMGLEENTGIGYSTFLERGAPDKLLPARNIGVMLYRSYESNRFNWAAGIFRDDTKNDTGASSRDGAYAGTMRISGTPIKTDASHLVHLGGSYSVRALRGAAYTVDFKGESALTTNSVAATSLAADGVQLAGLEGAWVSGPLSLQSEYVVSMVDQVNGPQADFEGGYIFASWFLTGETRTYKDTSGTFSRVIVKRPYGGKDNGSGAWEFALRYSNLNLNSEAAASAANIEGKVNSYTAGVNWYLNDYVRVMLNYTREEPDVAQGTATADILAMRLQHDV